MLDAIGLVIDRTDQRQLGFVKIEHLGQTDFRKVFEEEIRGRSAAVDYQQVSHFRGMEDQIETALVIEADELCLAVETLQRGVLVVGVESAMSDATVLQY